MKRGPDQDRNSIRHDRKRNLISEPYLPKGTEQLPTVSDAHSPAGLPPRKRTLVRETWQDRTGQDPSKTDDDADTDADPTQLCGAPNSIPVYTTIPIAIAIPVPILNARRRDAPDPPLE